MADQTLTIAGTQVKCRLAPKMVVFSPGFGVYMRSPFMKLFTDIVDVLPKTMGYVLFSYYEEDDGMVETKTTSEDAAQLINIVEWVRKQPEVTDIALIAHSRGCVDAAVAEIYPLSSVVMLAPPLVGKGLRDHFLNKPNAEKRDTVWYVPRSDGTTSIMPEELFDEYEALNLKEAILHYAQHQKIHAITAGADEVLGIQDYGDLRAHPNITFETIRDADHNFQDAARSVLLQMIADHLAKDLME